MSRATLLGGTAADLFCDALVHDTAVHTEGALAKPAYLETVEDPAFGGLITRISGDVDDTVPGFSPCVWTNLVRPLYSKYPMWSTPDSNGNSLLMLDWTNQSSVCRGGSSSRIPLFFNPSTYDVLYYPLAGPYATAHDTRPGSRRWHPKLADTIFEIDHDDGSVRFWNVRTDAITEVYTGSVSGAPSEMVGLGMDEGCISNDGKWAVVTVMLATDPYFYVMDLTDTMPTPTAGSATKKTADIAISTLTPTFSNLDWVSISPLGTYIIVTDEDPMHTSVFDWDPDTGTVETTARASFVSGHMDLVAGRDGIEYAVNGRGQIWRLSDGNATTISGYTGLNLSSSGAYHAGAHHGPSAASGWTLGRIYSSPSTNCNGELIVYSTDGRFYRLGHHRSANTEYYAVMSPNGKQVAFGSDWGGTDVQSYILDISNICP